MSNFPILDLVVGMIFIYFLLGIITNAIIEFILTLFNARAGILKQWILKTFSANVTGLINVTGKPTTLGQALLNHSAISTLADGDKSPSYIEAKNFVAALTDLIGYDVNNSNNVAKTLNDLILNITNTKALTPDLQRTFLTYAYEAQSTYQQITTKTQSEIDLFQAKVENWFNTATARLGGDLKRKYTIWLTVVIGTIMVVGLDVDSVRLVQFLDTNPQAMAKLAQQAYTVPSDTNYKKIVSQIRNNAGDTATNKIVISSTVQLDTLIDSTINSIKAAQASIKALDLPMGDLGADYDNFSASQKSGAVKILGKFVLLRLPGWLITILAISLGAPFWFDLLSQLANIRGTGAKPVVQDTSGNKKQ
jgi:hypothetical protein